MMGAKILMSVPCRRSTHATANAGTGPARFRVCARVGRRGTLERAHVNRQVLPYLGRCSKVPALLLLH
ncbi:unnamed protein product [Urochloa humidicola]